MTLQACIDDAKFYFKNPKIARQLGLDDFCIAYALVGINFLPRFLLNVYHDLTYDITVFTKVQKFDMFSFRRYKIEELRDSNNYNILFSSNKYFLYIPNNQDFDIDFTITNDRNIAYDEYDKLIANIDSLKLQDVYYDIRRM